MSAALHSEPAILGNSQDANSAPGAELRARTVQPCTAAQMAAEAGVSRRMIFLGLKVHRAGCEEMHRMVRDGPLSMNLAAVMVDLFPSHDNQRVVLAEFATLPPREWLGFARRVAALMKDTA